MSDVENIAVTLVEHTKDQEYILLTPHFCPPRTGPTYNRFTDDRDIDWVLQSIGRSEFVALDFETQGGDYSDNIQIVGLGLAWDTGSCYFDRNNISSDMASYLLNQLGKHSGLIAHNIYFDGGVYKCASGQHAQWHMCTYSLYSMLANEGWAGRSWGLKTAQTELLLWESSNEHELDEWLVVNGYYIGNRRVDNSVEYLQNEYKSGGLRPDKGEMWRAPTEILGKYCILDAESTYLLYTRILRPTLLHFPGLVEFIQNHWLNLIMRLIDQKFHGILMDREGLLRRRKEIQLQIEELGTKFLTHPDTMKHIAEMEERMIQVGILDKQPAQYKKSGEISKNWLKWKDRLYAAEKGELPEYKFNMNSGPQLRELLYDRLGYEVSIRSEKGEASVAAKALAPMGGIGSILIHRMDLVKELSFVDKYLELTEHRPTLHPSFRTPGTTTGRLSSKEPNLQQVPKTKAMMELFVARSGTVWVDLDFSALEPVVTTEYSKDENMMRIYGDNMPPNDIYIFVMAHIPGMEQRARALGYDPYNPTKEALARVKKEMKRERSICKTVVLACQYGAGVNKVHRTLEEQEIFLSYQEVETIHRGYWNLFSQVKDFSRALHYERRRNGGYILNAMGRPMAIPDDFEKDLLNRFVQSSGHDVLTLFVTILTRLLDESGIPWQPIVIDWHDAATVEVPEDKQSQTVDIFNQAMLELNGLLGGIIRMRGIPTVGRNMSEVKEPES